MPFFPEKVGDDEGDEVGIGIVVAVPVCDHPLQGRAVKPPEEGRVEGEEHSQLETGDRER